MINERAKMDGHKNEGMKTSQADNSKHVCSAKT